MFITKTRMQLSQRRYDLDNLFIGDHDLHARDSATTLEKNTAGRFLLPSLAIARFATAPPNITSGLLLIGIASTFGQPVGVMGGRASLGKPMRPHKLIIYLLVRQ